MNAQEFNKIINNLGLLNKDSLAELLQLKETYPYIENIRILYALNLLVLDDFRYHENLTKASFYASDRRKLKSLVDGMQVEVDDDFSLAFKVYQDTTEEIKDEVKGDVLDEEIIKVDKIEEQQKGDARIEKLTVVTKVIDSDESVSQAKKRIKQIRSKAELLQLVKNRLAEIEAAKAGEQGKQETTFVDDNVSNSSLIDKFISAQPSISRPDKNEFFNPQKGAVDSATYEDDFFVTETLASIHADQGNLQKALEIYRKLSLKFPEKSSYFAARIQDLSK